MGSRFKLREVAILTQVGDSPRMFTLLSFCCDNFLLSFGLIINLGSQMQPFFPSEREGENRIKLISS